ncbi:MAG: SRPBCC domain-containing protein [Anaerolineae bacterium]|jgi:uncharacterized protein YndB with AHSA1/START domain|nr:SRPBCC domain-containing protein [Anaerolineae bacterium]MBT7782020.1 SRPBCC domain-containing protein [Anaerolineae bacterium]
MSKDAIVIERIFDAPIEDIWKMWTQPEYFQKWYGPKGFTIPVAEINLSVGGKRRICMASPDGNMKMWTTGEHLEISSTERLVYTESMSDEEGNILSPAEMGMPEGYPVKTEITVSLESLGEGTKMVLTHAGLPADSPGASGWNQAFDKLEEYLNK